MQRLPSDSRFRLRFLPIAGLLILVLAIASCTPAAPHRHHASKPQPAGSTQAAQYESQYRPEDYLTNLSLARLALEQNANAAPYLAVMQSYMTQPVRPASQDVVLFEYRLPRKKDIQKLLAPIVAADDTIVFPGLAGIMQKLTLRHYTLHNIRILTVTIPAEPLVFHNASPPQILAMLERR